MLVIRISWKEIARSMEISDKMLVAWKTKRSIFS